MEFGFFPELEIALISLLTEVGGLDRSQNSTPWLLRMGAISEAAGKGEVMNVREAVFNPVSGAKEAKLAHAGCVNQYGTVLEHEQLTP